MAPKASLRSPDALPTPVSILVGDEQAAFQGQLTRRIAERAFELYERDGFSHGDDVAHWLAAENDLLTRLQDVREGDKWIHVNAPMPSVAAENVRILLDGHTAIVGVAQPPQTTNPSGNTQSPTVTYYSVEWPADVDPSTACAYVKADVLTLMVEKASFAPPFKGTPEKPKRRA
jgi:HSP20 family molecular chaperone IbpA